MRNHALFGLLVSAAVYLPAAEPQQRIQRVEQGLRPPVVVQGRPIPKMTIAERLQFYKVPGVSVAVIDDSKLEWARGYGLTAVEGGKPVTADTLFQAASLSKHVAAMVALHLVDQGKLSLDEDVNVKLSSWKVPENEYTKAQKVTLRRLLNHSAGLTVHGFRGYAADEPVPSLLEVLDGKKPANSAPIRVDMQPGTLWRYSGGGYEVMQQLAIDVTGKPFPQLAREIVLDPLGMSHSTYEQPLPFRYEANAATGHRVGGAALKGKRHTYPEMAAAGLWTTPSDLARVVIELQTGGHVLKPETQRQMLTKLFGDYGLGVGLGETNGEKSFSHGGSNEGFKCEMFGYLNGGRGAVVMTNGDRGGELAREILGSIAEEYGWADYRTRERTVAQVEPAVLRSYTGRYRLAAGMEVTVSLEGDRLFFETPAAKIEVFPESPTSFFSLQGGAPQLRFSRKEDGTIELSAGGLVAKRQ